MYVCFRGSGVRPGGAPGVSPKGTNTFWALPMRSLLQSRLSHVRPLYSYRVMSRNDHPCSTQEKTEAQRIQCPAWGHTTGDSWSLWFNPGLSPKPWLHSLPRELTGLMSSWPSEGLFWSAWCCGNYSPLGCPFRNASSPSHASFQATPVWDEILFIPAFPYSFSTTQSLLLACLAELLEGGMKG